MVHICSLSVVYLSYWVQQVYRLSLLRFEVSVNDAQAVEVVQSERQLCQVKLHILLREHHLEATRQTGGPTGRRFGK